MISLTADQLDHLGAVSRWLQEAPLTNPGYGEFHVTKVVVGFDGEEIGFFVDELENNDGWTFYPKED